MIPARPIHIQVLQNVIHKQNLAAFGLHLKNDCAGVSPL